MRDGRGPIGFCQMTGLVVTPWLIAAQFTTHAIDLNPATVAAFDHYVATTESRIEADLETPDTFLSIDRLPPGRRQEAVRRLRRGDAIVETTQSLDDGRPVRVPGGLIQHVRGTVFVPGVSMEATLAAVKDYDRYPLWFPGVVSARVLERGGDDFVVSTRVVKGKFTTIALDIDREVHFSTLDPARVYSRSYARNILGISNPGAPNERRRRSQNLWRLNNYGWFRERDEGVYLQIEAISLSRDVPPAFSWVMPFVQRIEKNEIDADLTAMRTLLLRARPSQTPDR